MIQMPMQDPWSVQLFHFYLLSTNVFFHFANLKPERFHALLSVASHSLDEIACRYKSAFISQFMTPQPAKVHTSSLPSGLHLNAKDLDVCVMIFHGTFPWQM